MEEGILKSNKASNNKDFSCNADEIYENKAALFTNYTVSQVVKGFFKKKLQYVPGQI